MSGVRTSSRHHERPTSARRRERDDDYTRHAEEPTTRSSTHRHRSSSGRNSPHKHREASLQETQRFRPEDYVLEDGVPPLRRQSTQPPNRRTSPTRHPLVAYRDPDVAVYRRREVEPTSGRRSSRHATPVDPALSTALVVVEEKQVSPRTRPTHNGDRASPRRHARDSPRRSHHDSRIETEDGVVRSPRQHVSPSKRSPRRAHRQTGSPIRPERRAQSSHHHRHASAEPRTRSPHGSTRRHRDPESARAAPVPETTHRQDTLRYRSPPLAEAEKRENTSRRAHRHSRPVEEEEPTKKRSSSRHHGSARRTHSERPSSRHESTRRHRHERHASAEPPASTNGDDESRRSRHSSRHRQASLDSSVAPRPPQVAKPITSDIARGAAYPVNGSTYVRPAANSTINARRSSGSYIEVISVNSARPDSSNSWLHSRSSAPQSPRRPREVGPPVVVPDPRSEKIMQRIDSTRHWIQNMKAEVEKDRARALQEKREADKAEQQQQQREREREEEAAAERARQERRRASERNGSARHHRSSSRGSQRRTRSPRDDAAVAAATPSLEEPARAVDSRRHPRAAIAPAAAPEPPRHDVAAAEAPKSRTRSRHNAPSASSHTTRSDAVEERSRRSAKLAAAPTGAAPAPAVLHETLNSSRKEGFDYPIFSFISFLDGNTFDDTAGLCDYNTQLAESLSDEHLDLLREVLFDHDEEKFAELLYGDDVQAELDVIANTLGHSEDPAVQREIVVLQRAAVRRFNDKCSAALRTLLAARGGLADAVQMAASELERQAYEAKAAAANSP